MVTDSCDEDDLARPFAREEDKWDHKRGMLQDKDNDVEDITAEDDDLEDNIVEPSARKEGMQSSTDNRVEL